MMKYKAKLINYKWYVVDSFGFLASEDMSYQECASYARYLNNI